MGRRDSLPCHRRTLFSFFLSGIWALISCLLTGEYSILLAYLFYQTSFWWLVPLYISHARFARWHWHMNFCCLRYNVESLRGLKLFVWRIDPVCCRVYMICHSLDCASAGPFVYRLALAVVLICTIRSLMGSNLFRSERCFPFLGSNFQHRGRLDFL